MPDLDFEFKQGILRSESFVKVVSFILMQEVHDLQSKGYELVFVECQLSLGMLPMLAILHCWLTRKKNNSIEEKKQRF